MMPLITSYQKREGPIETTAQMRTGKREKDATTGLALTPIKNEKNGGIPKRTLVEGKEHGIKKDHRARQFSCMNRGDRSRACCIDL